MTHRLRRLIRWTPTGFWVCLPMAAMAAAPGAGDLLREVAPRPAPIVPLNKPANLPSADAPVLRLPVDSDGRVQIKGVYLTGVSSFRRTDVEAVLADAIGRDLDFNQLQELAERVTNFYRSRGYLVARAYLPAQRLADGVLEIAVLEGRLGQLEIDVNAPWRPSQVRPFLGILRSGEPINAAALESSLLRLSDLPGVRVQSVLRPGEQQGATDLAVQVEASQSVNGSAVLDNQGNASTGRARATLALNRPNLTRLGDVADLSLSTSGAGLQYVRAGWQSPVGASGWQVGAAASYLHYRLGDAFTSLDANGDAKGLNLFSQASLLRRRDVRLDGQFALDVKRYDDQQIGNAAAATQHMRKSSTVLSTGLNAQRDDTGWRAASVSLAVGRLSLDPTARAADAAGSRTAGTFAKLGFTGDYLTDLSPALSASLRVRGQVASKNLDTSEKVSLGGPQAVRAYGAGEVSVDRAVLFSAELAHSYGAAGVPLRVKLFADAAAGQTAVKTLPGATDNSHHLAAAGLGVDAALPASIALQASAAAPLGGADALARRGPRLWLQVSKSF